LSNVAEKWFLFGRNAICVALLVSWFRPLTLPWRSTAPAQA
jgi:hypothetical protein